MAPKRRWLTVIALSAAAFIDSSEDYSLSILWPKMYAAIGASIGQLGIIASIAGLLRTVTTPIWGYAADRFSRKALLVGITGVWGLWTAAVALTHSLNQLIAVRIISSLGLGILWPAAFSLLSDLFATKERGKAAGIMTAISFTGTIASFGILPAIAATNPEGWRLGFVFMGVASVVTGLLMLVIYEPPRGSAEPELEGIAGESSKQFAFRLSDLPQLSRVGTWWVMLFNNSIDAVALSVLYAWVFTWLDQIKLGESGFMVVGLLAVGNLSGHVFFGWLGDVLDRRFPNRGRAAMAMIGLAVSIPALVGFIALGSRGLSFLIPFGLISGICLSSVDTGARWPITQGVLRPEVRASGRATLDMTTGIVAAIVALLTAPLVDRYGVGPMLLWFVPIPKLLGALSWIPIFWTYPRDRRQLHQALEDRRAAIAAKQPAPL
jgi:MFS family permease